MCYGQSYSSILRLRFSEHVLAIWLPRDNEKKPLTCSMTDLRCFAQFLNAPEPRIYREVENSVASA